MPLCSVWYVVEDVFSVDWPSSGPSKSEADLVTAVLTSGIVTGVDNVEQSSLKVIATSSIAESLT